MSHIMKQYKKCPFFDKFNSIDILDFNQLDLETILFTLY